MSVRVRFAPSPTGYLHVGGARTALFNWLFARKFGGTFILRVEDTDFERSSSGMTVEILEALTWMGIDWDEGPFLQSERLDGYRELARTLVAAGHAYYCFCSLETLATKREAARFAKTDFKYDRACFGITPAEAMRRVGDGEPAAIRFHVPEGATRFDDAVMGNVEKQHAELEDFVIVRSGGQPTYQLSAVADDRDMRVSHVIRGADHISNTPKQLLLYRALGATPPVFAHLPLILGPDKARLSKRHGATSVLSYRDSGIPPEAFVNFLSLLGWSDGTDRELFDRDGLVESFSLDGISRSNAVFDEKKLEWFSGQYINAFEIDDLAAKLRPWMEKLGIWEPRFESGEREWLFSVIAMLRPRFRNLESLAAQVGVYSLENVTLEKQAIDKFVQDPKLGEYLPELASRLEAAEEFDTESAERVLRGLALELDVKAGLLINAARVALTGQPVAPGIFDVMVALGRRRTASRLRRVVSVLDGQGPV